MNERSSMLTRDLSRYLEDIGGEIDIPPGTPLHILAHPEQSTPEFDEAWKQVDVVCRAAENAVGLSSRFAATMGWTHFPHRFAHGVDWTEFPILMEPRYLLRRSVVAVLHDASTMRAIRPLSFSAQTALARCPVVFLHRDPSRSDDEHADAILAVADILTISPGMRIFLVDGDGANEISRDDLIVPCEHRAVVQRFAYNYSLNFRAIAGKALILALEQTLDGLSDDPQAVPGMRVQTSQRERQRMLISRLVAGGYRGIDAPLLLQGLFRLKRLGGAHLFSKGDDRGFLFETDGEDGLWDGRGKHPKARFSSREILQTFALNGAMPNLIGLAEDGMRRLTPAGESFLDLLHPDAEDPNSICRWAGRRLDQGDRTSMDRWIMSTFSKVKTRVNRIGSDT